MKTTETGPENNLDSATNSTPNPEQKAVHVFRPMDMSIIIGICVLAFFSYFWVKGSPGQYADVYCQNKKMASFDLNSPLREKEVLGFKGPVFLEVGEGQIRVLRAPCRQKICKHMGSISRTSQKIICLPSRLWISIRGGSNAPSKNNLDGVSY